MKNLEVRFKVEHGNNEVLGIIGIIIGVILLIHTGGRINDLLVGEEVSYIPLLVILWFLYISVMNWAWTTKSVTWEVDEEKEYKIVESKTKGD